MLRDIQNLAKGEPFILSRKYAGDVFRTLHSAERNQCIEVKLTAFKTHSTVTNSNEYVNILNEFTKNKLKTILRIR